MTIKRITASVLACVFLFLLSPSPQTRGVKEALELERTLSASFESASENFDNDQEDLSSNEISSDAGTASSSGEYESSPSEESNLNSKKTSSGNANTGDENSPAGHTPEDILSENPGEENNTPAPSKTTTVTITIRCDTAVRNWDSLDPSIQDERFVPKSGVILGVTSVELTEGESVYDVLLKITRQKRIHMEHTSSPVYNSEYIRGINNLYEFHGGEYSGWMYSVNGTYPNYGCSRYQLSDGDRIEWHYTCDLGRDLGVSWLNNK